MLKINNLSANIEDKSILKDFSLNINPGEVHAIMGPNGSGKSTLSNILSGKKGYEISGEVLFENNNLFELETEERAHKGIFLAFQYPLEIPGVNTNIFLKTSLNAIRKARGEKELDAIEFLKLVKEKAKELKFDEEKLKRIINFFDPDVIVWTFKNYPDARIAPFAYAYCDIKNGEIKRILCMGEGKEMPRTSVVDVFSNGHQKSFAVELNSSMGLSSAKNPSNKRQLAVTQPHDNAAGCRAGTPSRQWHRVPAHGSFGIPVRSTSRGVAQSCYRAG